MEFDAVLLAPRRAESIAKGYWRDRTINDDLDACLSACPDKVALTAVRLDGETSRRFTYRELAALADRVAVGLSRLGVGRNCNDGGDAIAELVAILRSLSRLQPYRRGAQSPDASFANANCRSCSSTARPRSSSSRRHSAISTTGRWRAACSRTCRP